MSEPIESPFKFVADIAALDLVNTELIMRRKQRDLLQNPDDLALWWEHAQQHDPEIATVLGDPPTFDDDLLEDALALRGSLRRIFLDIINGDKPPQADLDVLNRVLELGHTILDWGSGENPQIAYNYGGHPQAGLLLPIALSALHILTQLDLGRLRKCHNDHCILVFYDTTKSATRQWCSTKCFDRERSARRYQEQQEN